ncbi:MAG: flagellar biosynthetic protein FliO [Planctomycetes bacterium]|nr:flagellar biosynthetic protein FliO [Planctomycetota bacterium]
MLWPLAVVLGVIGAVSWAARRWMPAGRVRDTGVIRTLGRLSLAPKHQMVAVQVGRRVLLVGVSPDRVSALGAIANPVEVADLLSRAAPRGQADLAFDPLLEAEASGYRAAGPSRARETAPTRNGGDGGTSRAVHELLEKVRSLKTK